jgi:hypothetical protein
MKKIRERTTNKDVVLQGFLNAALFTGTDSEDNPLDQNYGLSDFDKESRKKAEKIVSTFILALGSEPESIIEANGKDMDDLGIDLWMTMTGQGVGFWDGDWGDYEAELMAITRRLKQKYYVEGAASYDNLAVEIY